jgi:peptide/nickel transport system substrate-binding protein
MIRKRSLKDFNPVEICLILFFAIMILICLSGCVQEDAVQSKEELFVGMTQDISGFYPWISRDITSISVNQNFFNCLVEIDNKTKGLRPALAESWANPDNRTYRLYLRENVTFHNGDKFTADDVAFTLQYLENFSFYQERLSTITDIILINNYTLDIRTADPYPLLLYDLITVNILSKNYMQQILDTNETWPIGTGPYKLAEYVPGEFIRLVCFDGYWKGTPEIPQVTFKIYDTYEQKVTGLLNGDMDIISISFDDVDRITNSSDLSIKSVQTVGIIYLGFDCRVNDSYAFPKGQNPVADARVRKAIYHAIDITTLIDTKKNISSAVPCTQFVTPYTFGYNPEILRFPFDLITARDLMVDAGYQDGFSIVLDCIDSNLSLHLCDLIAQQLSEINITVILNPQPMNDQLMKLYFKNTSFYLTGFSPLTAEATIHLLLHTSDMENGLGIWNYGNYSNPAVDRLCDSILITMSPSIRKELIQEVFSLAMDDAAWVPLYSSKAFYGVDKSIQWDPRPSLYILLDEIHFT